MTRARRALGWAALALLTACATTRPVETREIYDQGLHHVRLLEYRGPDGAPAIRFDHPVQFTADDLEYVLGQVSVSTKAFRGWNPPEPVFGAAATALLAPHLAQAFTEATASEYIGFKVTQRVPGLLLPRNVVTAGTMFVRDHGLHVQLEYYNANAAELELIRHDFHRDQLGGTVRLEPGEHMRRGTDPRTGAVTNHWLVADWPTLQATLTARREARARRDAALERRRRETDRKSRDDGAWTDLELPAPERFVDEGTLPVPPVPAGEADDSLEKSSERPADAAPEP